MLPIPGLDPGPVDPSESAFASGMLAGAGLREISQVLGLSRKRGGGGAGKDPAMPSASTMLAGNMGDLDKMMILARLKESMGMGMGAPGPVDPMAMDPMAAMGPAMPGGAPMGPAGPLPGGPLPLPPPPMPGAVPLPLPGPAPMPGAPTNPGGALPLQMLLQMLKGAGGLV